MAAKRVSSGQLVANTATPVTLAAIYRTVEILNRGGGDITVSAADNGTTPATVLGDDMDVVPANSSAIIVCQAVQDPLGPGAGGRNNTIVSLISAAAVNYTVTGV